MDSKKIIAIMALLLVIIMPVFMYNSIVNHDEAVKKEWANLESTLQRRMDLIPNLVQTVKGYAKHESETFQKVVEARSNATKLSISSLDDVKSVNKFLDAQNELSKSLGRLIAIAEHYPDLKASQNFQDLQVQLEGTENRINFARQRFNDAIQSFNYAIRRFPHSLINKIFLGYEAKEGFRAQESAKDAPKIAFE